MARRRLIRLSFEKGLNESVAPSVLPPGFASRLQNWEPSPAGGLRARAPWSLGSVTGTSFPATRRCVGAGVFSRILLPGPAQISDFATGDSGGGGGSVVLNPTWKIPTSRGALLKLVVTVADTNVGTVTVTATGWTSAVNSANTAGRPRVFMFYKANAAPESGSVTVTIANLPANTAVDAVLMEVTGIALSSPLDATGSTNSASDATPESGTTAVTAQAVEFVVAAIADNRAEEQTSATNGFQKYGESQVDTSSEDLTFGLYAKAVSATGAQSTTITTGTADACAGAIATYKGWFTGTPTTGQTTVTELVAIANDTTEYDVWTIARDSLAAGTWTALGSLSIADASQLVRVVPGLGRTWFSNPQFGGLYYYDGVAARAATGTPAGRALAVHKGRVFVGGTEGAPSRLFFSGVNDGQAFNLADDYVDVGGREDGEPIEDLYPFGDGLLIGKRTGVWFLSGDGPSNFDVDRLDGGGCAPGASIVGTPYGAVIAGRTEVYLWSGAGVEPISQAINQSYAFTGSWMSVRYLDESVAILDQGTGTIFTLHMPSGTWRTERLGTGNLLTANQASLETGTTGWATETNVAIAQSSAQALVGSNSLRLTSVAGGTMGARTDNGVFACPVVPGRTYTAVASFRAAVSARTCRIYINWVDAAGTFLGNDNGSVSDSTSGWNQATCTAVAPAAARYAYVAAYVESTGGASEVHYVDAVGLHDGTSTVWGPGGETPSILFTHDGRDLYGPRSAVVGSLLNYRDFPAEMTRGKDFAGISQMYQASTDELWAGGPELAFTPEHLHLKIRQHGGDSGDGTLVVTPVYDGTAESTNLPTFTPRDAAGTYRVRYPVDHRGGVFSALYRFDQTLGSADAAVLDVEEAWLELVMDERSP